MKLGMMLEVDETFTKMWLSRSSEVRVKVRRSHQSPIGTIFWWNCVTHGYKVLLFWCCLVEVATGASGDRTASAAGKKAPAPKKRKPD